MTDTTILDHSRMFLSILRAPQRFRQAHDRHDHSGPFWNSLKSADLSQSVERVGVTKIREFATKGVT